MVKEDSKNGIEKEAVSNKDLIKISAIILTLWTVNLLALFWVKDRGTFGDMFGAVNALFSGFAFGGVIYAILLQRKELQLQRIELKQTRVELEGQKLEMQQQNKTISKQAFENTFFQLLTLHSEIASSIKFGGSEGKEAFRELYHNLNNNWNRKGKTSELDKILLNYGDFYEINDAYIGHYFRSLYNIFKFVNESNVENERLYTNLVRAQLSRNELLLLFYNCLSDLGNEKFKPLVEKYTLLKTVPKKALFSQDHLELYEKSAFEYHR